MGAIACHNAQSVHKAQTVPFKHAPDPDNEPGAFGVAGLIIAYFMALAVGIIANLSIEKFKSAMNIAAIAGFAVLWAAFWRSSRRIGADAENGTPYRDLRHHAVSRVSDAGPMMPKPAYLHATERWGPAPTIGFLTE